MENTQNSPEVGGCSAAPCSATAYLVAGTTDYEQPDFVMVCLTEEAAIRECERLNGLKQLEPQCPLLELKNADEWAEYEEYQSKMTAWRQSFPLADLASCQRFEVIEIPLHESQNSVIVDKSVHYPAQPTTHE